MFYTLFIVFTILSATGGTYKRPKRSGIHEASRHWYTFLWDGFFPIFCLYNYHEYRIINVSDPIFFHQPHLPLCVREPPTVTDYNNTSYINGGLVRIRRVLECVTYPCLTYFSTPWNRLGHDSNTPNIYCIMVTSLLLSAPASYGVLKLAIEFQKKCYDITCERTPLIVCTPDFSMGYYNSSKVIFGLFFGTTAILFAYFIINFITKLLMYCTRGWTSVVRRMVVWYKMKKQPCFYCIDLLVNINYWGYNSLQCFFNQESSIKQR